MEGARPGRVLFQKKTFRASEQLRDDVQQARSRWRRRVKRIDPERLIFLDESGVRLGMKRLYGRSARGWRIVDEEPGGHWRTHTMTAAIGVRGVVAAMVTRRAINSITFVGFVRHFLAPQLRPGQIVVMDNLAVHKVAGVEEALHEVGAEAWFLPPYSPDLNPIERAWSKVKALLRAQTPTTFRRLVNAIGRSLRRVTPPECRNYFIHSGYASTPTR
ncbi:MAG: IS630 family transposase [Planctomycetota bacterium]